MTDYISTFTEYIGFKKDDKKSRNNEDKLDQKTTDTSYVNKTEHLQINKISNINCSFYQNLKITKLFLKKLG